MRAVFRAQLFANHSILHRLSLSLSLSLFLRFSRPLFPLAQKIKMSKFDPPDLRLTVNSMYAEHEDDQLLFQWGNDGLELLETPFSKRDLERRGPSEGIAGGAPLSLIKTYLENYNSIPAYLAALTLELHEKRTFMPR